MFTQAIVDSLYLNIAFALFDENSGVEPCYVVDTWYVLYKQTKK